MRHVLSLLPKARETGGKSGKSGYALDPDGCRIHSTVEETPHE